VRAADIAAALGAAHRSGIWWRVRCPVHGSLGLTLALRDGDRALIAKCFAGCDPHDILAELRRRGMIAARADEARPAPPIIRRDNHADVAGRIAMARRLWVAAQEARGTPVAAYLTARGITVPSPPSLRYAPSLRRPDGTNGPAMVAVVEHVENGMVGVHRTWLETDRAGIWRRQHRASLGPIGGGAVRLGTLRLDRPLILAEGIESALAAAEITKLPAWAALSAGGITRLILPAEAQDIVIAADRDPRGTGEAAARRAAILWVREGRRVRIIVPDRIGSDPNDLLREMRHGG
jgi:hypothetical protein